MSPWLETDRCKCWKDCTRATTVRQNFSRSASTFRFGAVGFFVALAAALAASFPSRSHAFWSIIVQSYHGQLGQAQRTRYSHSLGPAARDAQTGQLASMQALAQSVLVLGRPALAPAASSSRTHGAQCPCCSRGQLRSSGAAFFSAPGVSRSRGALSGEFRGAATAAVTFRYTSGTAERLFEQLRA